LQYYCSDNRLALRFLDRGTVQLHLKCLYGQQGFCDFGISTTSENVFTPKKKNNNNNNSCAFFALKSSFKFPASTSPNEVNRVMKDWRRMTSLQEHLKASYFYFA